MPGPADATVFFVGNATMIIRSHGFTLLTDPNFLHQGQRAHLGWGLSTRRRTEPAMEVTELPPLDLVVLSHLHGDHWDRIARDNLDKDLPIVTTRHAAARLRRQGFGHAVGLEPWEYHHEHHRDGSLTVTATPGRHAPGSMNSMMPPVMGSVLDFAHAGEVDLRLHISGDTIMDDCLSEIPRRFPDIDVGIVHLGGTRILGRTVTMDGAQGVEWLRLMQPESALPVHYDDYTAFASPLGDFRQHVRSAGLSHLVHYLMRGETYRLPVRRSGVRPHRTTPGLG